jgi:diguanylate cyclase (GGDEF)-like protein
MGGAIALQCLGVTISIFVLFLHFQDDQITHDILTGLNNSYALDAYLEAKVKDYVDGAGVAASLYLLMMDVNYFKTINDNYGHTEGDKALKAVADSLKRVGARYKSTLFLARFGGDEFAAVFESNSERKVKLLCNEFKAELAEAAKEFRYPLKMGVGYALYRGYNMSIESFYEVADKSLYEDKDRVKNAE